MGRKHARAAYSLTEQAIELVPVFVQLGAWGRTHLPATPELAARADVLASGGPSLWDAFMDELREAHLGLQARRTPPSDGPTVRERMETAYAAAREAAS